MPPDASGQFGFQAEVQKLSQGELVFVQRGGGRRIHHNQRIRSGEHRAAVHQKVDPDQLVFYQ